MLVDALRRCIIGEELRVAGQVEGEGVCGREEGVSGGRQGQGESGGIEIMINRLTKSI